MADTEVNDVIDHYENTFRFPATDVLATGAKKLVGKIISTFPELEGKIGIARNDDA